MPGTQQAPLPEILHGFFFFLITVKICGKKDAFTGEMSTFLGKTWTAFTKILL